MDGTAEATEKLRAFFTPDCHLRTLPLELARRARDTAFFINPSRGLGPADLVGLGLDEGRGDEVEDGRDVDVDGDSSSSVSSALPSKPICFRSGSSGKNCPRPVKMFRARLKGEMGGECAFVSSEGVMRGKTLRGRWGREIGTEGGMFVLNKRDDKCYE